MTLPRIHYVDRDVQLFPYERLDYTGPVYLSAVDAALRLRAEVEDGVVTRTDLFVDAYQGSGTYGTIVGTYSISA